MHNHRSILSIKPEFRTRRTHLRFLRRKKSSFSLDREEKSLRLINLRSRFRLVQVVLRENKELVIGPGITLVPQLFSLPLLVISFTSNCDSVENNKLRYVLITSYFVSFTPQLISFLLYVLPSSFYSNEWNATSIGKWINRNKSIDLLRKRQAQSVSINSRFPATTAPVGSSNDT